jgi:hypothetical protein
MSRVTRVDVAVVFADGTTKTAELYPDPAGDVIGYRLAEAYRYLNVDAEEEVQKLQVAWEMVFPGAPFHRPF